MEIETTNMNDFKNIHYTEGGISLVLTDLSDLIKDRIGNSQAIVVNTSSQPNSKPHLGTLTTLITAYLLAKKFANDFNIPSIVQFDKLENSPSKLIGSKYTLSLGDVIINEKSVADINMESYIAIFEKLKTITEIPYTIRSYEEYQRIPAVRKAVLEIYKNYDTFLDLLSPSKKNMPLRVKCPNCNISNRDEEDFYFSYKSEHIILRSFCPEHGDFVIDFNINNDAYIDMNSQLRDLTKGIVIENDKVDKNIFSVMCDGKDWSGEWAIRMHYEGMHRLGYKSFTTRFFTPMIVDWSGGKHSKSIYLKKNTYIGYDYTFSDFDRIMNEYGEKGFQSILNEVQSWIDNPIKFYRNYSNEYFNKLLNVT